MRLKPVKNMRIWFARPPAVHKGRRVEPRWLARGPQQGPGASGLGGRLTCDANVRARRLLLGAEVDDRGRDDEADKGHKAGDHAQQGHGQQHNANEDLAGGH